MINEAMWLMPLILLPGVALLIVSTSSRYYAVHDEIHRLMNETAQVRIAAMAHEMNRAKRFRNALVSLYMSVALFSTGSLLGGLTHDWPFISKTVVAVLTAVGVTCVVYSSIELIRESRHSLYVINSHFRQIEKDRPQNGSPGERDLGGRRERQRGL
jgi:hypothetical protein